MTRTQTQARWPNQSLIGLACVLIGSFASQAPAQTSAPVKKGSVEKVSVHGAALQGNLEGDSPDRDVFIYLPPGYAANRNQRYPVVYLLHGYGLTGERWMTFTNLAAAADKNIAAGTMREMILVNPDAFTKYSGSMYSASATTGDWESYIADDLVSYVDSHYRTLANRMSRRLGGHSMGGYGTIRIGMKRPDVFSSLYIMSACCLMNNPFPAGNRGTVARAAPPPDRTSAPGATAGQRGEGPRDAGQGGRGRGGFGNVQAALAAAFSPNPKNPPDFFDNPIKDGELQPPVVAKWAASSPLAMIAPYVTNPTKYHSSLGAVGTADSLAAANRHREQIFIALGGERTHSRLAGNHTNRVIQRIEMKVLPFFSSSLAFSAQHK